MSVFEVRGGPINRRYLDRKTKHELSDMYMTLLDAFTKMEARARIAEQEKAELVECLRAAIDYIDASPCDPDITAEQRAAHMRLWDLSPRAILATHEHNEGES